MEKSERFARGLKKLQEIDGEAGQKVIDHFDSFSPELVRLTIEYSFGEVYSLTSLANKSKEVVALASLIAQGAVAQQKVHFNGALNVGCSVAEVKELILQMSVYAGFPRCINAMNAFMEVVQERRKQGYTDVPGATAPDEKKTETADRYRKGAEALSYLDALQVERMETYYKDFAPEIVQYTLEYGFADIHSRPGLDKVYRQLATVSAIATLGNATPQLKFHLNAALNIGITPPELKAAMLLMTVYAGFPAALNGMNALKEVLAERK